MSKITSVIQFLGRLIEAAGRKYGSELNHIGVIRSKDHPGEVYQLGLQFKGYYVNLILFDDTLVGRDTDERVKAHLANADTTRAKVLASRAPQTKDVTAQA